MKKLTFEDMSVILPENNMREAWERLVNYMTIYFEMHGEQITASTGNSKNNNHENQNKNSH